MCERGRWGREGDGRVRVRMLVRESGREGWREKEREREMMIPHQIASFCVDLPDISCCFSWMAFDTVPTTLMLVGIGEA
jgi:hypothetical protein